MRKYLAAMLALLLALLAVPALGESVIVNRIVHPEAECEFAEGAQLLEIYFPRIYGVDAAYVCYGEYSMLIDCAGIGSVDTGVEAQWPKVQALLDGLGVTELTYAVNSHPDADHIGGFNHVLKNIPCGEFILGFPEDYDAGDAIRFKVYSDLHEMGIPFRRVGNGDTLEFGDVQVTVYQRLDESIPRVNGRSITLMIQLGERRIFFTGDIMTLTQRMLYDDRENLDLHADILKYPHHGYEPLNLGFQQMVAPELCVITSGASEAMGVAQLRDYGIRYVFTSSGTLHMATDGQVWLVERID